MHWTTTPTYVHNIVVVSFNGHLMGLVIVVLSSDSVVLPNDGTSYSKVIYHKIFED